MMYLRMAVALAIFTSMGLANAACVVNGDCNDSNACTVDTCVAGTCVFTPGNAGAVCRPVAGPCDVAETCTGTSATCPTDSVAGAIVVCRSSTGACDPVEHCDGSTVACPADVNSCGVCPTSQPVTIPKLIIAGLQPPPGDERLRFKGEIVLPFPFSPALNPTVNGVRFIIQNGAGATLSDTTIPGGAFDTNTLQGWITIGPRWIFLHKGKGVSGIRKVVIKDRSNHSPGLLKFSISAKKASYSVLPGDLPVKALLVLDPPTATSGQCGRATFPGPAPTFPACNLSLSGNTLLCK
jgi:hypothetical protein